MDDFFYFNRIIIHPLASSVYPMSDKVSFTIFGISSDPEERTSPDTTTNPFVARVSQAHAILDLGIINYLILHQK